MIESISIKGFKSLKNVQDLQLGRVNVFVGANGSGKTNLLEAVGFLGAAASGVVDNQALSRRGVRLSAPYMFKSSFQNNNSGSQPIEFNVRWKEHIAEVYYNIKFTSLLDTLIQPVPWTFSVNIISDEKKWTFPPMAPSLRQREVVVATPMLEVLSDYAVYSPNTPVLRGIEPDKGQRTPVGLAGGQLAEAIQEIIDAKEKKFGAMDWDRLYELFDWIEDISITRPSRQIISPDVPTTINIIRFTDRWMAKKRNQLSAYDASEGALYVLFALALALHFKSPRLFAIENLDQAMHPRLARATIRLFCEQILKAEPGRQALITTHNPLLLDGLDLSNDEIRLFTVERDYQGATRIDRVQVSEQILQAVQDGLSLSNLWIMGRIGGAPDIF